MNCSNAFNVYQNSNFVEYLIFHNTAKSCDGLCGQGEGDCDSDSDCLPGLVCYDDWWWKDDYCEAGITDKVINSYLKSKVTSSSIIQRY